MFEEVLVLQNLHWSGEFYDIGVERSCFSLLVDYFATGQVVAITGVRRAGKSTLIKQLINHLILNEGADPRSILFANLEHPYLSPYREESSALQRLYDDYVKMMQPKGKIYIFLDEVQFFKEWPVFVKAHHEMKTARFVVTGSNAAMLSSDMVTLLSGRSLPLEIFPFSFREVATSRDISTETLLSRTQNKLLLQKLLEEFLQYGGFPTVILCDTKKTAFDILGAHARTVLLQDVVPRLGIRKPAALERLYVYLVSNIGKLFTYQGLGKLFDLSDKSIKEYLQALSDAHLLYEVDLFSYSLKQQIRSPKKIYSIDTGQTNAMGFNFSSNRGRLLENLLFIDFKRLGCEVYYYKNSNQWKVDFVVRKGKKSALVQVSWDLTDPSVYERECRSLEEARQELGQQQTTLITEEPLLRKNSSKTIHMVSAEEYLILPQEERLELLFETDDNTNPNQ